MKNLFIALLVVTSVFAYVDSGSYHYNDACMVAGLVQELGFSASSFNVSILPVEDLGVSYFIAWIDDYYSGNDADVERVSAGVIAAAVVSRETNWSSTYVCVGFTNKMFIMTTQSARYLQGNINSMSDYQITNYITNNIMVLDQ